jgi:hypothetical protein
MYCYDSPSRSSRRWSAEHRDGRIQLESLELAGGFYLKALLETICASIDILQLREVSIRTEFPHDVWETIKSSLETLMWEHTSK